MLQDHVAKILNDQAQIKELPTQIEKLSGDASYREYYRVHLENQPSLILMKMPPGASSVSEEITKTKKQFNELPFINVQKYLTSLDLPVPQIIAHDPKNGLLLLQDLGDQTLEVALTQSSEEFILNFYQQALDLLITLQSQTQKYPSQDCISSFRHFDADLLTWELNHFLEYGIEDRLKIKIEKGDRHLFESQFRKIVDQIKVMPQGFVHRDFQSRNLMVHSYHLWMLDFQDALQGPALYDLVALLRDSYIGLNRDQLEKFLDYFIEKLPSSHPYVGKKKELKKDFNLITIQRKLKDTGRFQYIHTVKGNPKFLKHVPLSLSYVREALGEEKNLKELDYLLKKYLPE